jgi:transposase-like protein
MFLICSEIALASEREGRMARISKAEYARIVRLVDVDGRKVAEVAAEYSCTTANIYALLGKLRRNGAEAGKTGALAISRAGQAEVAAGSADPAANSTLMTMLLPVVDLLSAVAAGSKVAASPAAEPMRSRSKPQVSTARPPETRARLHVATSSAANPLPEPIMASAPAPADVISKQPTVPVPELPRKGAIKNNGVGGALAKPGFGLMMRTEDGDENLTPFRSLDDLLSAVKPILRSAARSVDPVWFSIQAVDLSTLDSDAG